MRILLVAVGFLAAAVVFNVVVDPYGAFFVVEAPFNRYKPEILPYWRTGKSLRVTLTEPDALIMGSSRVMAGMDPAHPAFAGYRAFNFGLPGANYCDIAAHFAQIAARQKVRRIVIGLDLFGANANLVPPTCRLPKDLADPLLAFPRVLLSIDTFNSSRRTAFRKDPPDPRIWQPTPNGLADIDPASVARQGGPRAAFLDFEKLTLATSYFTPPACRLALERPGAQRQPLDYLATVLAAAHARGIEAVLYLSADHARMDAAIDAAGEWAQYEAWQRGVVDVNEGVARAAGGKPFAVWDFGGFNSVTTEDVPPASQKTGVMQNYWDASHFNKRVGDWMLARMFGTGGAIPADFGVRLTPANLAEHLARARAARDAWKQSHPEDLAEVKHTVDALLARPECARRTP